MKIIIQLAVATLFLSAFVFFISRIQLYFFLSRRGVKIIFGLAGIPGYLEKLYIKAEHNVRDSIGDRIIKINKISLCFLVINTIIVFLLIANYMT